MPLPLTHALLDQMALSGMAWVSDSQPVTGRASPQHSCCCLPAATSKLKAQVLLQSRASMEACRGQTCPGTLLMIRYERTLLLWVDK